MDECGAGLRLRALLAAAALLVAAAAAAQVATDSSATALSSYVTATDASYAWNVRRAYRHRGAAVLELTLHSQTWRGVLWKHQLVLIKPRTVTAGRRGLLVIGGGRWSDEYDTPPAVEVAPDGIGLFVRIAEADRDFRDATWSAGRKHGGASHVFDVARPGTGYSGMFAEVVFSRGRAAYSLSTNLAVLASTAAADPQARPSGTGGVCAAVRER
jgi:PhoPQ-activated pathogenicity-related protein